MSFGGSGNEGNSRNATNTTTITTNTDNRMVVDNGSVGIGAGATGNTVNITDGGAIDAAFEFANNQSAIAGDNYNNLLNTTDSALAGFFDLGAAQSRDNAKNYDNLMWATSNAFSGVGDAFDSVLNFAEGARANEKSNYQAMLDSTNASLRDLLDSTNTNMTGMLSGIASTQNFIAETQNTAKGALDSRTITLLAGTGAALIAFALWRGKK